MKKNILLVEYDENYINLIKQLFAHPIFDVSVANDGETAKRLLASKHYDLMVTAAMLPRFHGFNLSLAVANEYTDIKIIIISAIYKGVEYRHQAVTQYKADDFFEKPFNPEKFKQRVYDLLGLDEKEITGYRDASTTHIPLVDTSKFPAVGNMNEEVKKVSSQDIFGDIIKKIEKVPSFEIKLEKPAAAPPHQAKREPIPRSEPTVGKRPVPFQAEARDLGSEKRKIETERIKHQQPWPTEAEKLKEEDTSTRIQKNLQQMRREEKPVQDAERYKKLEDEISKKFEDTLSGLGIQKKPDVKPKPVEAAPAPVEAKREEPVSPVKPTTKPEPKARIAEPMEQPKEARPVEKAAEVPKREQPQPAAGQPDEVGNYDVLGLIARGGMAEIYKAKKKGVKGFEKIIAIKKILSGYGEDDKYIEMFVDEAKIAAELSHPSIVQIYDLGKKDNYYFIAMEYVQGKDLREILRRLAEKNTKLPEELSIYLISKVLEALNYAHKAKDTRGRNLEIVHRDVSPPNILISYNGDIKLTDFGVSKAAIKIHQTISGALKGKLLYMSPEQARGEASIDHRSDLYSVGVILFELMTGRKLFLDHSEMKVLKKVQNGEIIKPSDMDKSIDREIERIILKSLSEDRERRFQHASEMISDLQAYVRRKFDYIPGPVHLAHFMFRLFEEDILREGVKIDLKPLPEKITPAKIAPQPKKIEELPPEPDIIELDKPIEIDLREKVKEEHKEKVERKEPKRPQPQIPVTKPEPRKAEAMFTELAAEKKSKLPLGLTAAAVLITLAVVGYFFFIGKKGGSKQVSVTPPTTMVQTQDTASSGQQMLPGQNNNLGQTGQAGAGTGTIVPTAEQLKAQEAEQQKQEEEIRLQKQKDADRLKALEEKRKKQEEERLLLEEEQKKQEEERLRLAAEEEQKKQVEQERLRKEEEERQKNLEAEKRRQEEQAVREGKIIPLNEADIQPVAISTPNPVIPLNLRNSMASSQTYRANILIDHNGNVEKVALIVKSGNNQMNTLLEQTLLMWKFRPASKSNIRVKVWKIFQIVIK